MGSDCWGISAHGNSTPTLDGVEFSNNTCGEIDGL
jgi:hypothetical protein